MAEEKVLFESGEVKVTNARFVVGAQTYAMNGVTSVRSMVADADIKGPLIAIVVGVLALLGADGGAKFFGLLMAAAGAYWWYSLKSTYYVMLNSSSGESRSLISKDKAYIDTVIEALNNALVHRG